VKATFAFKVVYIYWFCKFYTSSFIERWINFLRPIVDKIFSNVH